MSHEAGHRGQTTNPDSHPDTGHPIDDVRDVRLRGPDNPDMSGYVRHVRDVHTNEMMWRRRPHRQPSVAEGCWRCDSLVCLVHEALRQPCPVCSPNWNDLPVCWGNCCSRLPWAAPSGAHGMASRAPRYPQWHPIAARERQSSCLWEKLRWTEFPDAYYTPQQAMMLARLGKLLVSHHHGDEFVTMLIKSPRRSS
jgi:hypothetical protein